MSELTRAKCHSQDGRYDDVFPGAFYKRCGVYTAGSPGWKTYYTSAPAYVVLNALETCDYKVVAASSCSTPSGSEYMWTLQGPVDREVDQAQASFSDF